VRHLKQIIQVYCYLKDTVCPNVFKLGSFLWKSKKN
jgi:hypothetical protein